MFLMISAVGVLCASVDAIYASKLTFEYPSVDAIYASKVLAKQKSCQTKNGVRMWRAHIYICNRHRLTNILK